MEGAFQRFFAKNPQLVGKVFESLDNEVTSLTQYQIATKKQRLLDLLAKRNLATFIIWEYSLNHRLGMLRIPRR